MLRADVLRVTAFALALLGLILQDGSLAHQHRHSQPGLFNHDHDLSNLAAVGGGLVPDGPRMLPGVVVLPRTPAPSPPPARPAPRRPGHPRAPPHPEPPTSS